MSNHRIDLREKMHSECMRCDRSSRTVAVEEGNCTVLKAQLDGLIVRCVGPWAYEKIYRLYMHFGIFASGMKKRWKGLNYLEIGCGPGRCVDRTSGKEIDGSCVAILLHPGFGYIKRAVYIDNNPEVVNCLNQRIRALGREDIATSIQGNYEIEAELIEALSQMSDDYLNLVFVDPTDCGMAFNSIRAVIAKLSNADLIINVALGTDVSRNLRYAICDPAYKIVKEKYQRFLGDRTLFENSDFIERARHCTDRDLRQAFMKRYVHSFERLGYNYSDHRWVKHYYCLLFLSRSKKGLEFWKKACRIDPYNQRELFS